MAPPASTLVDLGDKEKATIHRKKLLDSASDGDINELSRIITENRLTREDLSRAKDVYGRTPLILAAMSGHLRCCELLISIGVRVNAVDKTGWNAIGWASRQGNVAVVDFLCQNGAHIDSVDAFGISPISYAAQYDLPAVVQCLAARGASLPCAEEMATWPPTALAALKQGQRHVLLTDDKKKRDMTMAKKVMAATSSAAPKLGHDEAIKEQAIAARASILAEEVRILHGHPNCQCPLKNSRRCNFFEPATA